MVGQTKRSETKLKNLSPKQRTSGKTDSEKRNLKSRQKSILKPGEGGKAKKDIPGIVFFLPVIKRLTIWPGEIQTST